jgi:hypothetical protein
LDGAEDIGDFAVEGSELKIDYATTGVKDYIYRRVEGGKVVTDRLAHAALDAVAIDGLAHDLADGESDAGTAGVCVTQGFAVGANLKTQSEKIRHLLAKLLTAGFVDALIVSVFAESEDDGSGHTAGLDLSWVESRMTQF